MPIKKLEGTLVYVQVQKPVDCFVKEKGQERKASIVVDEDTADAWEAEYPKQPAKAVKTAEFEESFKIPPPHPTAKKQYIITLRKNTMLSNGEPVPEQYTPKVYQRNEDGELDNITMTVLPANGSKGVLAVEHYDGKMGPVARLKNVLVTDLIPYEGGSGDSSTGFEDDEPAPAPKRTASAPTTSQRQTTPRVSSRTSATSSGFVDDTDSDIPF